MPKKKLLRRDENGQLPAPRKLSPAEVYKPKKDPIPPGKRSTGPRSQYDWAVIRDEYVNGYLRANPRDEFDLIYPTYEQLAQRHGCAHASVMARGAKERWRNLKDQARVEVTKKIQRKRADKIAHAAVQFDDNSLKVGEMGVALIMSRLGEVATEMRERKTNRDEAIAALGRGEDVKPKDLRSAVYHQEMLSLANAAEKFQAIGLRALGQQDGNGTAIQVNVDASTNTTNVAQELIRDDKERAGALVAAFAEIGALPAGFIDALDVKDRREREDVVDAEIVEDTDQLNAQAPSPTESMPDGEGEEEYELDPEVQTLIDNMPTTSRESD